MPKLFDITPRKKTTYNLNNPVKKSGTSILFYLVTIIAGMVLYFSIMQNTNIQTKSNQEKSQLSAQQPNNDNSQIAKYNTNEISTPADFSNDPNIDQKQDTQTKPEDSDYDNQNIQIDKTQVNIRVLNASGSSGVAAKTKKTLESDGYIVSTIGTANNIYTKTIIYYNIGKEAESRLVAGSLLQENIKFEENSDLTGSFDLLIVVGRE